MTKIFIFFFIFCSTISYGQNDYYSSPVKIPILLSGNFAELRSNHFHSGIDIKTQGVTGFPIHSAADGFISRIVVSPTGYGNALYIRHPNGTTTVYGHLQSFRKDIAEYIKEKQYLRKSFKVDLQVSTKKFKVKKEEVIAKSGNSGSSGGPHLHFEIRDTKTEKPLNPLKYNFDIKDSIPPKILSLMITPISDDSYVIDDTRKRRFPIAFYDGKYHIKNNPAVPVFGEIGFAIETNDYLNGSWNKCGIYSLQLTVEDELYFSHQLDKFSFAESRYINSFIDYETYINLNRRFQKTWVESGNKLSTYNYVKDNGTFKAYENGIYKVQIKLKDTDGNSSVLEFRIESKPKIIERPEKIFVDKFYYNTNNQFNNNDIQLDIPNGALYKNIKFNYKTLPIAPG
ncbi:MAG: peptidoglycan DD-metalloendopeptidase family protein, partial [Draconibacterium sp.]|nr:peptidoglycan DD-metalloendopeptidase family protein [Draconibacterium sp.]